MTKTVINAWDYLGLNVVVGTKGQREHRFRSWYALLSRRIGLHAK